MSPILFNYYYHYYYYYYYYFTKKDSMRYTKLQKDVCHNLWRAQTALIHYTRGPAINYYYYYCYYYLKLQFIARRKY